MITSAEAYFLEGEFPGIKDWNVFTLGRRTYSAYRSDDCKARAAERVGAVQILERPWGQTLTDAEAGNAGAAQDSKMGSEGEARADFKVWLDERRAGWFARNFTFPAPVNTNASEASLGQGLTEIMVPKVGKSLYKSKEIHVRMDDE